MSQKVIATIKLMPGQVGYYDEYSRIYLTLGNPVANVYAGTNCAQLRRSVKNGTIGVVSGSLGQDVPPLKVVQDKNGRHWIVSNVAEEMKPVMGDEPAAAPQPAASEPSAAKPRSRRHAEAVEEAAPAPKVNGITEEETEVIFTEVKEEPMRFSGIQPEGSGIEVEENLGFFTASEQPEEAAEEEATEEAAPEEPAAEAPKRRGRKPQK